VSNFDQPNSNLVMNHNGSMGSFLSIAGLMGNTNNNDSFGVNKAVNFESMNLKG
jgi:hypothetical protein